MIYTMTGQPIPPSDVVRRLKQVDENLDLKFVAYNTTDYGNVNSVQYWAIIYRWRAEDPRNVMIQRGDMPRDAAYDVVTMLPLDCEVHQAFSLFERGARQLAGREDANLLRSRVHKWNEAAQQEAMKETKELAEELIATNAGTLFREEGKTSPKVFMTDARSKKS